MNVARLFHDQAARTPHAPALLWDGGRLTYGELAERSAGFARLLAHRGMGARDRVAILLPNHPAFAVALLGTFWHGAAAVVLSPAWTPSDAARALGDADARLVVTTTALATAVGTPPESTMVVDDQPALGALGAAIRAAACPAREPADRAADIVASILFSSGTTGDPKGVMLTHGNLAFNARSKIRYCGIMAADALAMVVPMAHCFGQNVVLLGALLAGAAVRLHDRFEPASVSAAIAAGEVSMLFAAPTAFERLLADAGARVPRRLRFALTAAAPAADGLASRWAEAAGCRLSQGYGLTECSPFAAYDPVAANAGRRVGRAIDGVEIRVGSPEGEGWAGADTLGEIAIRGPNVMAGYWRRPMETAAALRGGWLRTGDMGLLDGDGALHVVDRVDDVINVAGFKAWPSDVERVLRRHPDVVEAAAYGVPDAVRGATVGAAVVLREGVTSDLDGIVRFAAERLAGFQRPTSVHSVVALPRSASGKVLRRVLSADVQPR